MANTTEITTNITSGNADLERAVAAIKINASSAKVYESYYKGVMALNFASDKFRKKFWLRLRKLVENLCKPVVDVPTARLEVVGFGADLDQIDDPAWQIWKRNLMPLHSKRLHRQALKVGDGFCVVWQDPESRQAKIHVQDEGSTCVLFKDDETGKAVFGAKGWRSGDLDYLTLYFPDRIEKYVTRQKNTQMPEKTTAWIKRTVAGEEWPLANPWNVVPMFHFTTGSSMLTDVIPLNDALNKSLADTFVGLEYNSTRQRYTAGISFPIDPETGKPIVPFEHDDQYVTTTAGDAKIGEFSDMQLGQVIGVSDSMRQAVARVSGIPAHYFYLGKGDFPSGESQRKSETRLISLVIEAQLAFGEAWSQVMDLCLTIEGSIGDRAGEIEVQWSDAAESGDKEELENGLLKKDLGWSLEKIQAEYGLSKKEILEMAKQKKKEQTELGSVLGAAFDRGEAGAPAQDETAGQAS